MKIIHKLSLKYICEGLFNVQEKHVPWDSLCFDPWPFGSAYQHLISAGLHSGIQTGWLALVFFLPPLLVNTDSSFSY